MLKVDPLKINDNVIGNTVVAGCVFFILVAGAALGFIGWTMYHWNHRVVRCSQPLFLGKIDDLMACIVWNFEDF